MISFFNQKKSLLLKRKKSRSSSGKKDYRATDRQIIPVENLRTFMPPEGLQNNSFGGGQMENIEKLKQTEFQTRTISCLMIKLTNFESLLEHPVDEEIPNNAPQIQKILSDFYTILDDIAVTTQGFLTSFSSFFVMYWNVYHIEEEENHLEKALHAAITISQKLKQNHSIFEAQMGIGQGFWISFLFCRLFMKADFNFFFVPRARSIWKFGSWWKKESLWSSGSFHQKIETDFQRIQKIPTCRFERSYSVFFSAKWC